MKKFSLSVLAILILSILAACTATPTEPIVATRPVTEATATAVPPTATLFPTPTPVLTPFATALPTFPTPPALSDGLDPFVQQLERFVMEQNYDYLASVMSNPVTVGAWRSEWRQYEPTQIIHEFQNGSLPAPLSVQFTHLSLDELTQLIGQPPETMFGPAANVVAALHSIGWGQSASDEAILFITEEADRYAWSGFLYTNGRFADANLSTAAIPVGLIYSFYDLGLYQMQRDGQVIQLLDAETANTPNLALSPDGRYAAYINDQQQLWLINTATQAQQQYAADYTPSGYLLWGDNDTLFVGIWLDPSEGDGPNNGHIATLEIPSGDLQILDETHLSGGRPNYLSDYTWSAFDVFSGSQDDILTGRLYHPDSGLQIFDQTTFAGNSGNGIFNPAWSPAPNKIAWLTGDGERRMVQVFDMEAKTAVTLLTWDPARFGALVPSPVWGPDGQWLALEVWANGPEGSGIWLLAADGRSQTLVDAAGRDPHWVNDFQLIYSLNDGPRLYDINSGEMFRVNLLDGSRVWGITPVDDLPSDTIRVTDPAGTKYVYAVQDVTIYSGPSEDYEVIGPIFAGQTALVTGAGYNNNWWRVICPDDTIGNCWVTGDTALVVPVDSATPQTELPDPSELQIESSSTEVSPDGRWQATASRTEPVVILQSEKFYTSLTVTDGTTIWAPVAEWRSYGLGDVAVAVVRWSADGRYLYYTNTGSTDGCGLFFTGTDLHRLDVSDGTVQTILEDGLTGNFSLSPDETAVAYLRFNGQGIVAVVQNVASGQADSVVAAETADGQAGNILWSPDNGRFLFTIAHNPCSDDWTHSIVRVDAADITAVTLIANDPRRFTILEWADSTGTTVRLQDDGGNTWLLNVDSGDLTAE
ncbi:MAG: hypothetical protein H6658_16535 [Ardenticatenaceae bacterium]|nr:hypothetical protein [Ardenticatenaceae bacterium]